MSPNATQPSFDLSSRLASACPKPNLPPGLQPRKLSAGGGFGLRCCLQRPPVTATRCALLSHTAGLPLPAYPPSSPPPLGHCPISSAPCFVRLGDHSAIPLAAFSDLNAAALATLPRDARRPTLPRDLMSAPAAPPSRHCTTLHTRLASRGAPGCPLLSHLLTSPARAPSTAVSNRWRLRWLEAVQRHPSLGEADWDVDALASDAHAASSSATASATAPRRHRRRAADSSGVPPDEVPVSEEFLARSVSILLAVLARLAGRHLSPPLSFHRLLTAVTRGFHPTTVDCRGGRVAGAGKVKDRKNWKTGGRDGGGRPKAQAKTRRGRRTPRTGSVHANIIKASTVDQACGDAFMEARGLEDGGQSGGGLQ